MKALFPFPASDEQGVSDEPNAEFRRWSAQAAQEIAQVVGCSEQQVLLGASLYQDAMKDYFRERGLPIHCFPQACVLDGEACIGHRLICVN